MVLLTPEAYAAAREPLNLLVPVSLVVQERFHPVSMPSDPTLAPLKHAMLMSPTLSLLWKTILLRGKLAMISQYHYLPVLAISLQYQQVLLPLYRRTQILRLQTWRTDPMCLSLDRTCILLWRLMSVLWLPQQPQQWPGQHWVPSLCK